MKVTAENKGFSPLTLKAHAAFVRAVDQVAENRRRIGGTMAVLRDGHVCRIHPGASAGVRDASPEYKVSKPPR